MANISKILFDEVPTSRRTFLKNGSALGAGLLLPGFFTLPVRAQPSNTITYALSAYPPNLRPFEHAGAAARTVKVLLFRGLLSFDDKGQVQTELAERWELIDPRTYVFHIRENAFFQNGEPVTADDVKYSFDAIRGENSTAYLRAEFQEVESIDVMDPKTVRITLKQPKPTFTAVLAGPHAPIVFAGKIDDPDGMIGAGPYLLENSERGVSMTFKARTDFYKPGQPKTEKLNLVVYADDSLRVAALNSGDVDIIEYVPFQSITRLKQTPGITVQGALGLYMYLVFNLREGPFTNPLVRRAVAHAIKREDIVEAAFLGHGEVLDGLPIAQSSPYYNSELAHLWPYDPDLAKSLLREAGAENMQATLLATSTYDFQQRTAEVVQQHLAAIGMNVRLSLPEWGVRISQGNEGNFQFAVNGGSAELGDPDELGGLLGSGSDSYRRSVGLADPELDDLLLRGRYEGDQTKRREIYDELKRLAGEKTPVTYLNYRLQAYARRDEVKDFKTRPDHLISQSGLAFDEVYIG